MFCIWREQTTEIFSGCCIAHTHIYDILRMVMVYVDFNIVLSNLFMRQYVFVQTRRKNMLISNSLKFNFYSFLTFKFHFNSDSDYEPNILGDIFISILISIQSDFNSNFHCKPNKSLVEL